MRYLKRCVVDKNIEKNMATHTHDQFYYNFNDNEVKQSAKLNT